MTARAGARRLTTQALRLDRHALWAWPVAAGAMVGVVGVALERLYPTVASREGLAKLADSPVLRAVLGPLYAPDSIGGLVAWRSGAILAIILGLATTFLVVRRTRAEEQQGRGVLVLTAPVGRGAPVAAALADAAVLDLAATAAIALALLALGQTLGGSVLLGVVIGACAWSLGGFAAVIAQVAETSKGANGAAAALIAVLFLLHAVGELVATWLLWLNPLAWIGKARAFGDQRPWVVLLPLALGAALGAVAGVVATRREVGRGLLPERHHASRPVGATPTALAWRLERVTIGITVVAATLYSVAIGSVVGLFNSFVSSNPAFEHFIEQLGGTKVLEDAFTTTMTLYGGLAIAGWAISMVLRLHQEEERGRVAVLLANDTTRTRVFDGFSTTAVAAGAVALLLFGTGIGVGRALADHHASSIWRGTAAGLVAAPAMLVLVAIAMLAVGVSERTAPLAWAGLVYCAIIAVIGAAVHLPKALLALSPFWHVPPLPLKGTWWVPCVVLLAVAAVIGVSGRLLYTERELGGA